MHTLYLQRQQRSTEWKIQQFYGPSNALVDGGGVNLCTWTALTDSYNLCCTHSMTNRLQLNLNSQEVSAQSMGIRLLLQNSSAAAADTSKCHSTLRRNTINIAFSAVLFLLPTFLGRRRPLVTDNEDGCWVFVGC